MSVHARLQDAKLLWDAGRRDGAFTMILIATAATGRKRYPRPIRDRESFMRFIRDCVAGITAYRVQNLNVEYPTKGRLTPIEDVIYEQWRCNVIHEARFPLTTVFGSELILSVTDGELMFPEQWLLNLAEVVRTAPENAVEILIRGSHPK